ncbi:hypothetical protein ACFPFX_05060 [Streptomyces mauvecolor]|uniref:DUF7691 domain-containing protein n=1 Tax=Streptomyces mauvecolor TaxID=58345 RepID=A0ABV9UIR9_9ACTN
MSRIISFNTADQADVVAFLGAAANLTSEQQRLLGYMRDDADEHQHDLDREGIDWGLSVPDALEHLIAGRADSEAECAGNAYYSALQHIIDANASDPSELGVYSKPSTFFGLMDDELRRLGVRAHLLPHGYLFTGPPASIPFPIPCPVDGSPGIGMLALSKAKPAADAYRAVLDQIDPDFTYDLQLLAERLEFEHNEWQDSQDIDWYTQDTIFFSIKG